MRQSKFFGRTLREAPAEAQTPGHRLMLRAAIARPLAAGLYTWLPLGFRVQKKVEQIIREEQDRIGAQEMEMPVLTPAETWKQTGRWDMLEPITFRTTDHNGREFMVSYTHEEFVHLHAMQEIQSYKQLPQIVYHFQSKGRDEARPRAGLLRVREFVMKDAYSCDRDQAGLDASYEAQHGAYVRTFERLGLETVAVASDVGIMGGSQAHEFMVLNPAGEDVLVLSASCGYAANRQVAIVPKPDPEPEEVLPLEEVATPGTTTIATLAAFLGIGPARTAKAAFFVTGDGRLVTAIVRGDHEVNETKLGNAVKAVGGIRPATVEEIRAAGMEPGYGSPIGAHDTVVVVDDLVARSPNLVAGANRDGFHYRNVNVGRDFTPDVVADITNAQEGDPCPVCGEPVILRNGIEVGNIFKLGTKFSDAAGATYLGEDGQAHPIVMGSYGIGVGRNVACIVEAHHDDKGIIWPAEVAPYAAHLVSIGAAKEPRVTEIAQRLHDLAKEAGLRHEILWDDREESPGVKFTDAELLGMPWILTVSPRSLAAGGVEVTERATGDRSTRPIEDVEALLTNGFSPSS
jgi:prolyl-tRNA synthetase